MDIQGLGVLTFLMGLTAFSYPRVAFGAFVISCLLGSAAALFIGAANIQPAHVMLGFVALGMLTNRDILRDFQFPRAAFWMTIAAIYGIGGAYFLPRFFAGQTYVTAIGVTEFGYVSIPVPLGPTSGNITQSIYFAGGLLCFITTYAFASQRENAAFVCKAVLAFCVMNIVFGVLDVITFRTGTAFLLNVIRNANYTFHVESEIAGLKRIAGSFTETSAFASACLATLGFSTRLWLGGVYRAVSFPASVATLALLIFSTSSTAYVALPVLLAFILVTSAFRATRRQANTTTVLFVVLAPLFLFLVTMIIVLTPELFDPIYNYIDISVLSKSQSDSGLERTLWNRIAMQNFVDTYGFGVGIGGVRASSFVVAVLANMGMIGAIAYFGFIAIVLTTRVEQPESFAGTLQAAAQTGCVGLLGAAILAGAGVDLGLPFYVLAGIAVAMTRVGSSRSPKPLPQRLIAPSGSVTATP